MASFQAMFSVLLHLTGRFFSPLTPFSEGPRHCGQFSARSAGEAIASTPATQDGHREPLRPAVHLRLWPIAYRNPSVRRKICPSEIAGELSV